METLFGVMGGLVLIGAINRFIEWRRERREVKAKQQFREESMKEESMKDDTQNEETQKPDTLGLMFKTLSEIGCQPSANDDGTLSVQYQGENFHMEFGGMYARVWDPMWAGVKADDPDMPKIREAVNAANFNFGPTVVLTAPNEEGIIGFHSRRDIMLHPAVLTMYLLSKRSSIHSLMQKSRCATTFSKSTPNRWRLKRTVVP